MEAQQLNFKLKTRTHKQLTKDDKRWLRQLVSEGKKTKEISQITGWPMGRVRKARAYHIKRIRKNTPLKLATTEALSQELISRGTKVNIGETLKWIGLAVFILVVVISIARM